jgi:hypothetical protein
VKDEKYSDSDCISVRGAILVKDNIIDCRMNIKSKTGKIRGYMRRDNINPNRINIYDKYENRKGFLVRDNLYPDAWFFRKKE